MTEGFRNFLDLVCNFLGSFWEILAFLLTIAFQWSLAIVWFAWWLWGVNWKRVWPVLAQGAWVVVLLLTVLSATVWAELQPTACSCLGFTTIPNFWWQLGGVCFLVVLTFFCGWLQQVFSWQPADLHLQPPLSKNHVKDHASH